MIRIPRKCFTGYAIKKMDSKKTQLDPYGALDKLPIGIFVLRLEDRQKKEFRNIFVNKTDSEIVGTDLEQYMGKTLRSTFPTSYEHGLPDKYLEALDSQRIVKIGEMQYGDDKVKRQSFFLQVVPLDHNTIMLTTENISTLRKVQLELQDKNESLENKNFELEEMTRVVSHDLKSPLNTITGLVHILEKRINENNKELLQYIEQSCKRMKALIEDILDYSLIGSQRNVEAVDCNQLIEEIKIDLNKQLHDSRGTIESGNLPTVIGYRTELRQLFQNLLSNALKFIKPGLVPSIKINATKKYQHSQFSISDNGIGIDKINFNKIFGVFKRLQSNTYYEGTGIGLAHCKKIVHLHQGEIWVESALGKGSTFYFTLRDLPVATAN